MVRNQFNLLVTDQVEQAFRGMGHAGDMVKLQEPGAPLHGVEEAENGVHCFAVAVLTKFDNRRFQLFDHVLAFGDELLDNFNLIVVDFHSHR